MELKLLIDDMEYLQVFAEMLMNSGTSVFAERVESLETDEGVLDVLYLTDREDATKGLDESIAKRVVYLTPQKSMINTDNEDEQYRVFKYDSVSNILSQLILIESEVFPQRGVLHASKGRLFVVAGTVDSEAYPDVARFVARQLAYLLRGKVLLISTCSVNNYRNNSVRDEFLRMYYCMRTNAKCDYDAFFYEDEYGINYMRTDGMINLFTDFSNEEFAWFMDNLLNLFPIVVADASTQLNVANRILIRDCELPILLCIKEEDTLQILEDYIEGIIVRPRDGIQECEMKIMDELTRRYGRDNVEY